MSVLAVLIPKDKVESDGIQYLLKQLENTGLKVDFLPNDDAEEKLVSYLIGIDDTVAMRIAAETKMKRENLKGEWERFTLQNAVNFPTTFQTGERLCLIQHVLDRISTKTGDENIPEPFLQDDMLVHRCIQEKYIEKLMPLHDPTEKAVLMATWVKSRKNQPLDLIRIYFGDQVGFYFSFLGFYTKWLIFPSIFGTLVAIYQHSHGSSNFFTAFFALSMTIWATAFLEFWKRNESEYGWRWGVLDLELVQHERPEFQGVRRYDELEQRYVTTFSNLEQSKRYMVTMPVLFLALIGVVFVTFFFFRLDSWANQRYTADDGWWAYLAFIPNIAYSVVVLILDTYYLELAVVLNKYENHRTESEYANSLVIKLASFYLVNNFGLLFYIAFFVRDFDLLHETLSSLLITRQLIGNVRESLIPYMMAKRSEKHAVKTTTCDMQKQINTQRALAPFDGTFDDYLELFVQFGQITLFAAAYPLAPLCSLINNIIEIRSDAFKMCTAHQRPSPVQCKGIGTWLHAFEILGYIAVLTNCTLIGLNTGQLEKLVPNLSHALTVVLIMGGEHIMIMIKLLVEVLVPDVPSHIVDAQKRERLMLEKTAAKADDPSMIQRGHAIEFGKTSINDLTQQQSELDTVALSKSPAKWMEWIREEQRNRQELQKEVNRLNQLYMQWIHKEQAEKQKLQKDMDNLLRKRK